MKFVENTAITVENILSGHLVNLTSLQWKAC